MSSTVCKGSSAIEVTEGLEAGAEVVLADLDAALPSADSGQQGPGRFGGSGFSVGGSPGGAGFPGGAQSGP